MQRIVTSLTSGGPATRLGSRPQLMAGLLLMTLLACAESGGDGAAGSDDLESSEAEPESASDSDAPADGSDITIGTPSGSKDAGSSGARTPAKPEAGLPDAVPPQNRDGGPKSPSDSSANAAGDAGAPAASDELDDVSDGLDDLVNGLFGDEADAGGWTAPSEPSGGWTLDDGSAAECPAEPPPLPIIGGPCLGIYYGCSWSDASGAVYTCICDWVHWLCI